MSELPNFDFGGADMHNKNAIKSKRIGKRRVDSGESRVDSGQQEFLLRQQQADSGEIKVDSGEIKVDSGEIKVDSGNALQSRAAQKEATGETLISNEGQVANAENLGPMQVAMPQSQNLNDPTKRVLTAEGILAHIESTDPAQIAAANEKLFTQSMQLQCAKSFYQFALDKSSLKPTLLVGS